MGLADHRANSPGALRIAVLSVSSTRSLATDVSGHWIAEQAGREGHRVVAHRVVPDAVTAVRRNVVHMLAEASPEALIITGGTGISPKDVTIEAVQPLFDKELTAFGPIFAQISFAQIASAAVLSRATAGIIDRCLVFCLPGSLKAVQLACTTLVFPEVGHLYGHAVDR